MSNTIKTTQTGSIIKPNYPSTEGKTAQQIAKERIDQAFKDVKPNHWY